MSHFADFQFEDQSIEGDGLANNYYLNTKTGTSPMPHSID